MGCLFFDLTPPRAFDFDQKLSRNVVQIIFTITWPNNFFLAWFDSSRAFDFRMFRKNINCFRFWRKTYTKRCTSNYLTSRVKKRYFAVYQVLSILGYDLENGTRRWKFRFWYCSAFVYFADLKTIYFAFCLCCSWKLF